MPLEPLEAVVPAIRAANARQRIGYRRLTPVYSTFTRRRPEGPQFSPEALRRKYGKYLPHQRANVDQVPLPFVNDMDSTYDMRGARRVSPHCSEG